jgi:hypothetical protein
VDDEIAVCLYRKDRLCNAGDEERVENSGDKRKQEKKYERWFYLVLDYGYDISLIHKIILWCPLKIFMDFQTGKADLLFAVAVCMAY